MEPRNLAIPNRMDLTAATIVAPVRDLGQALAWYRSAFLSGDPELRPMADLAGSDIGSVWLQLAVSPDRAGADGVRLNLSVVEYFELIDLDGNAVGFAIGLS